MNPTKSSHIVVTGAAGFIGFHTVQGLGERNYSVNAFDLKPSLGRKLDSPSVSWHYGDMQDLETIRKLTEGVDGIIHLAGISRLSDGFQNPHLCMMTNTIGALNVLECARVAKKSPWVILGSTREVQDVRLPNDNVLFQNARGVYGLSKLCSEFLGERFARDYGLRVLTLRFSDVYGSMLDNFDRVLPKFVVRAIQNAPITVTDSPNEHDFTYYADVVEAIVKGVQFIDRQEKGFYDAATICTGNGTKIRELATLVIELAQSKSFLTINEPTEQDAFRSSPLLNNTDRARKLLSFTSRVTLEEGLKRTIAVHRQLRDVEREPQLSTIRVSS